MVMFKGLVLPEYMSNKTRYLRVSWSRPKTEWVDPLKDSRAAAEEVAMGVNTITEICEVNGRDIEEVVATRKYENELFKKAGLVPDLENKKGEHQDVETGKDENRQQPDNQE